MLLAKAIIPLIIFYHPAPWIYLVVAIVALMVFIKFILKSNEIPPILGMPAALFIYASYHLVGAMLDGFTGFTGFCLLVTGGAVAWGYINVQTVLSAYAAYQEEAQFEAPIGGDSPSVSPPPSVVTPAVEQIELHDTRDGVMLLQATPGKKDVNLIGSLLAPHADLIAIDATSKLRPYKGPVILNNLNKEIAQKLAQDLAAQGVETIAIPISQTLSPKDLGEIKTLELGASSVVVTTNLGRYDIKWDAFFYLDAGVFAYTAKADENGMVEASKGKLAGELFLRQDGRCLKMSLLPSSMTFAHLGEAKATTSGDNLQATFKLLTERAPQMHLGDSLQTLLSSGLGMGYRNFASFQGEAKGQLQLVNATNPTG